MKSNSIIDQYSASGDDELNDETVDAEDSEDDGARKIDIREYLSDVCGEIDNDERHENQCGLLESAIAFRMSTLNRVQRSRLVQKVPHLV